LELATTNVGEPAVESELVVVMDLEIYNSEGGEPIPV
jgi:hypothetical protein